jgi:hypothetical protein
MSGIRYIDINQLPRDMSEDNRQFVTQLARSAPKPTYLLMIYPEQYVVTADMIDALKADTSLLPEDLLREVALLKGKVFMTPEAYLLAIEERIGPKDRARYEAVLLNYGKDPMSGKLVPGEIPPLSTKALELVIGSVHKVLSQILARNSNSCQCWQEYALLEEQKMDLIEIFGTGGTSFRAGKMLVEQGGRLLAAAQRMTDTPEAATDLIKEASNLIDQGTQIASQATSEATATGNLSKTAFEKKLSDIDRIIQTRWKEEIPARYAEHLDQESCPHCRKPRQLDDTLTLATPEFLNNLFNIALGGEMPLTSILPFVESVFSQIYNPDMIPEGKKKDMAAFAKKIQLPRIQDTILNKILTVFGIKAPQPPSTTHLSPGASTPNTKADSTATTPTDGNSPRMMLTDDFLPDSGTGSTTNIAKDSDKTETN